MNHDDGFEYISITREQAETLWRDADVMWLGLVSGMHHKVNSTWDLGSPYLYLRVRSDG